MKKPLIAYLLNVLMPGAGLWYLGKRKEAFINFGLVLLLIVLVLYFPSIAPKYKHYIIISLVVVSAIYARMTADMMNRQVEQHQQTAVRTRR